MRKLICSAAATLALCLASSAAQAQASRTWVSATGNDANPCSRTAPCRTFAGAIPRTAASGEIDVLDAGEYGRATITAGLTIDGRAVQTGRTTALASIDGSAGALVVNAGPADVVVLRGLSLQGGQAGVSGILFQSGAALHVEHVVLSGFTGNAIDFRPAAGGKLFLRDVTVRESGAAGVVLASGAPATPAIATVSRSSFQRNALGLSVGANAKGTAYQSTLSGNTVAGVLASAPAGGTAELNLEDVSLGQNGVGLQAEGAGAATLRASSVRIDSSSGACTRISGNGAIPTFQNNAISCSGCVLAPSTLPAGTTAVVYPTQIFAQTGALGSVAFTVTGALPIGLTLVNGVLSGTPHEAGSFPVTITAAASGGCTASIAQALTIAPAPGYVPTTLALTSSANPALSGAAVTLSAAISPASATPTGTVAFFDGTTQIGNVAVAARAASLTTSALPNGSHALRAVYSGDNVNGGSAASITQVVSPGTFTVATSASSQTVDGSQKASFPLTVDVQGTLAAPISFACDGLPASAQCTFSPETLSASGAVTVAVAGPTALTQRPGLPGWPRAALALAPLLLLGARRRRRALARLVPALVLFGIALSSCSSKSGDPAPQPKPGTYSFSVVATSGLVQRTTALQLTVR